MKKLENLHMMKQSLFPILFLFCGSLIWAQPTNDECLTAINLGAAPNCTNTFYTNVDATASDIGNNNIPTCFNGGTVQRDVWFQFTTDATITDYDILVTGGANGGNDELFMPQVTLYRGDCNTLDELFCISAPVGVNEVELAAEGLLTSTTYYIRVNDYSTTASANDGTFNICVNEFVPDFNMGDAAESTACIGRLFDSGGPNGDYGNSENEGFKICPDDPTQCISIFVENFDLEEDEDFLNVYAGEDASAPLIAKMNGVSNGNDFEVQASSNCVFVEFISDGFITNGGFVLEWECLSIACDGSSLDDIDPVPSVPFSRAGLSTCDFASTFGGDLNCPNIDFLGGPERVFSYNSAGRECVSIQLTNADDETGVLVLNALPSDPNALCIASSPNGNIASANLQVRGTYYIIVANALGCTDFNINIAEADCNLSPALINSLCNPINNCAMAMDGSNTPLPSTLFFEDGFQDINIVPGQN